jgi:hypothetical protein
MKKVVIFAALGLALMAAARAYGQQLDAAAGVATILAPASTDTLQSMKGGAYPVVTADFLVKRNFGIGGEVTWRGSQAQNYLGAYYPYRPIFWDFDGVWAPRVNRHLSGEFLAGIGGVSTRFYNSIICNYYGYCVNYSTSTHFLGSFGAGLRYYFHRNAFLRPEARLYLVGSNEEFSSSYAGRVGITLGYSFGRD